MSAVLRGARIAPFALIARMGGAFSSLSSRIDFVIKLRRRLTVLLPSRGADPGRNSLLLAPLHGGSAGQSGTRVGDVHSDSAMIVDVRISGCAPDIFMNGAGLLQASRRDSAFAPQRWSRHSHYYCCEPNVVRFVGLAVLTLEAANVARSWKSCQASGSIFLQLSGSRRRACMRKR